MAGRDQLLRQGKCIRIFIGEAEEWQGKPLYRAIMGLAWSAGVAGITILRGIEGFGPEHHLSTVRIPDLSDDLPLIVEIVDSEERIENLLPLLDKVVRKGTITVTPVEIIYAGPSC